MSQTEITAALFRASALKPHRVGFRWMIKFHRTPQIKIDKAVQPV
jgi:hypothetical protein